MALLNRPSSRRKSQGGQIELNLVPLIDSLVTLIGFLLFTMTFLNVAKIESPFPTANPNEQQEKLKERPLQLTVTLRSGETEIWSPFERITAKKVPHLAPGQPDLKTIHESLIEVKRRFLTENKAVFVPEGGVTYDVMVAVMDSIRGLDKTDPPLFLKNATTGIDEPLKALFPEIVFGNLLGES